MNKSLAASALAAYMLAQPFNAAAYDPGDDGWMIADLERDRGVWACTADRGLLTVKFAYDVKLDYALEALPTDAEMAEHEARLQTVTARIQREWREGVRVMTLQDAKKESWEFDETAPENRRGALSMLLNAINAAVDEEFNDPENGVYNVTGKFENLWGAVDPYNGMCLLDGVSA